MDLVFGQMNGVNPWTLSSERIQEADLSKIESYKGPEVRIRNHRAR